MGNIISCSPEITRPEFLLEYKECQNFGDMVIGCYFATHRKARTVAADVLELICSKYGVLMDDEIIRVPEGVDFLGL